MFDSSFHWKNLMSAEGSLKARIIRVRIMKNTRNKLELSLKDDTGIIDALIEFRKEIHIRTDHAMNLVIFG